MIKLGTLFSGVGTPELAFKILDIPHENVFACEIDEAARKTFEHNYKVNKFFHDVYEIDGTKQKINFLIGGSPCQSFSVSGKRLGVLDKRGELIYEYFRLVEETKPKVFIYENVKGFTNIDKGETFENFINSFKELGYKVYYKLLNTKDFNIPQNRERIYIVGFLDHNVNFIFPEAEELTTTIGDFLDKEEDVLIAGDFIGCAKRGRKQSDGKVHQQIEFRKDNLINTITTVSKDSFVYDKLSKTYRYFTPREAFKFQGFPEEFKLSNEVPKSSLLKQLN